MTPSTDTPHQRDDRNAAAPGPFSPTRSIPNRPISGKSYSINRHPPSVERAAPETVVASDDTVGDSTLVFDAIFDAFRAQRTMLRAFAQLRGDDDADLFR
jgi:hypothetical protein